MSRERMLMQQVGRLESLRTRFEAALDNATALLLLPVRRRPPDRLRHAVLTLERERASLLAGTRAMRALLGPAELAAATRPSVARRRLRGAEDSAAQAGIAFRPIRNLLRRWPDLVPPLRALCEGRQVPLYPETSPDDPRLAQARLIDAAFGQIEAARRQVGRNAGAFPDTPLPPSQFLTHLHAAWRVLAAQGRAEEARFLDVGCGTGGKVLIAATLFAGADGIEIDPDHAEAAGRLLDPGRIPNARSIHVDAMRFGSYGAYDVVYLYHPINRIEAMAALEAWIARAVRPGTIFIAPYQDFFPRVAEFGLRRVAGPVGVAGLDAEAAGRLAEDATRIGVELPGPRGFGPHSEDGILAPLVYALRLNGYAA